MEPKSHAGEYSIEALDLNRLALRRLRDIRKRLTKCDQLVAEGVLALRIIHIDQLPSNVKALAASSIISAARAAEKLASDIDSLLRDYAHSPFIELDSQSESLALERKTKLEKLEALHPGSWRAPRKKRR